MSSTRLPQPPGSSWLRFRLAALLLTMSVAFWASKLLEDSYIDSLRADCTSLFRDRLMPATTLFHLNDDIHNKRHALVRHLSTDAKGGDADAGGQAPIDYQLGHHDASIDRLIDEIENTYLVDEESRLLEALKTAIANHRRIEAALLEQHRSGQQVAYEDEAQAAFEQVRHELLGLTAVQQDVGQQLDRSSITHATNVSTLLYFQLGVAFVLGLLASGLAIGIGPRLPDRRHRLQRVGDDLD